MDERERELLQGPAFAAGHAAGYQEGYRAGHADGWCTAVLVLGLLIVVAVMLRFSCFNA